jgi:hypothetical protein
MAILLFWFIVVPACFADFVVSSVPAAGVGDKGWEGVDVGVGGKLVLVVILAGRLDFESLGLASLA